MGWICPYRRARQPQVGEDLLHELGILKRRQQTHPIPADRAGEDVHVEGAPQEIGPPPVARVRWPPGLVIRRRTANSFGARSTIERLGVEASVSPSATGAVALTVTPAEERHFTVIRVTALV